MGDGEIYEIYPVQIDQTEQTEKNKNNDHSTSSLGIFDWNTPPPIHSNLSLNSVSLKHLNLNKWTNLNNHKKRGTPISRRHTALNTDHFIFDQQNTPKLSNQTGAGHSFRIRMDKESDLKVHRMQNRMDRSSSSVPSVPSQNG